MSNAERIVKRKPRFIMIVNLESRNSCS